MTNKLSGTNITSMIVPFTESDQYPTHDSKYGKGGYHPVNTIADRNAIPPGRRELYMTVGVAETGIIYKLISNPTDNQTTDSDWENILDVNIIDTGLSTNISLWESSYYKTSDCSSISVSLHTSTTYGKIIWCLQVKSTIPSLSFSNTILWRYDNDLELSTNSYNVFEFETWDGGSTWLARANKYSISTPEQYVDTEYVNKALEWNQI
jgi:hypothetical protein